MKFEHPSVMCGDSLSDLGALLAADFGLIIGNSSSLRKVMTLTGIQLQPLSIGKQIMLISGKDNTSI